MNGTVPIYSISAVAKALGIPVATLRTWEDRYGLIIPERSPSRHRLYTRQQVEHLKFVKSRMNHGLSAADAHRLLGERLANGVDVKVREISAGKRLLVLLAENDPYAAEFEEHFLHDEGYEIEVALDLDSARRTVERDLPSLVVVELLISGGLGLNLCRDIKHLKDPPPVLAISTLDSEDRALEAGADDFLSKPLDPFRFTSTVHKLVSSSRSLTDQSAAM